jgi:hypothetical protein
MPVLGLKVLHLSSSNLGLLFTSMGAGSVVGAVFVVPLLRARLSPDCLTLGHRGILCRCRVCGNRVDDLGFRTLGGSAAQDANLGTRSLERHGDNDLTRGMALGKLIWGSAGPIAGTSYTFLGAAVLLLASLFLAAASRSTLEATSKTRVLTLALFVSNQERRRR